MKKKYQILLLCTSLVGLLQALLITGCANMIPPTGGPKDSLPPKLLTADPANAATNFNQKTINFSFDEYVALEGLQENLIVSPTPQSMPIIEAKLKTISIKLKDSLEKNTTYSINFGNAIKDINEGIILPNFLYTFSTGSALDTLELFGKVVLAETGSADSTLIVMLHRSSEDSALLNQNPRYVTKLNGQGNFRFRFLPAEKFYLYALKDEGGTRKYFSSTQLFAFAEKPVVLSQTMEPLTLFAFAEKKVTSPLSVNVLQQSVPSGRAEDRRLKYATTISNQQHDLLNTLSITFEKPLQNIDTSKLKLSTDTSFTAIPNYGWKIDSTQKKIVLQMNWQENTRYNLILDKEFASDSAAKMLLKTDTLRFTTKSRSNYGSVKILFSNLDFSKSPILQFVLNNQIINTFPLVGAEFVQPLFPPGNYELRILFDENKNGKWDAGIFFGHRKQPEIVKLIEQKITIKPDWDNEFEIKISTQN